MQKKTETKRQERGKRSEASEATKSKLRPAGRGGRNQQAGGPEHRGLDAREDRNP